MKRTALKVEYDGTDFRGWQLQPGKRTVQGELERAAALASGETARVILHGAGRTDAGVHALSQVAHFDSCCAHSPATYRKAINYWLPSDICIKQAARARPEFHSRFSAESKTYRYSVIISSCRRPLQRRFTVRYPRRPDSGVLNDCANLIRGEHDFAAFTSAGSSSESTVRRIYKSQWIEDNERLHYYIEGSGFTYNMIRGLVGSMLQPDGKNVTASQFEKILKSKKRSCAGPTAKPEGLILMDVSYPEDLNPFEPHMRR